MRAGTIGAFFFPSGELFGILTTAAVLLVGMAIGPEGGLTVGTLVAFAFLVTIFLEPVAEFTEILDMTQQAVAGWKKVLDVLDTPVEVEDPRPGLTLPARALDIELDRVSFAYHGGPPVLTEVSAAIPAGTKVALVGTTGSGKTTLAKLLIRLADPTGGAIRVAGVDLRQVSLASLRSALVMVPQDGFLFDTSVADNVRMGRPEAGDREVRAAFEALGLGGWVDALPRGVHTRVGERGDYLSVGERQLVALARGYLADPGCLILDEATSAVDPATEVALRNAIERLTEGRTALTIAHRLATAEHADLILVLERGRLVQQLGIESLVLALVGGGDGAGDQGRGHVAVGQDPVVEAAQTEGVAQAGLGGGPEALQLQAADQVAEGLGRGHGVAGDLGAGGRLLQAGHRDGPFHRRLVGELAGLQLHVEDDPQGP